MTAPATTPAAVQARWRYHAAASQAVRAYPGALGELAYRELTAYADLGHLFGHNGLLARLVEDLLAVPAHGDAYSSSASASAARAAPSVSTGR